MRGNIPIPEIPHGEDLWLMVLVTSVRERRTQQGRLFCDASARNATGIDRAEDLGRDPRNVKKKSNRVSGESPANSKPFRIVRSSSSRNIARSRSSNIANTKTPSRNSRALTPSTSKH